ncbi:UDP-glucose iridoid glucosyltransferase [Artemisia annua]|uniref:UDP-glucose iridoid glucosyltransferase n=1 Tax=Artemisia annua TaxID=35608 RepID=A0A2U1KW91_ARTAN|nr:UDP-glucose iridoid glucosyltransferase [Artemisia annua]
MDENELAETAWGLADSKQPFLCVVRPGSVNGSEWIEFLPDGYMDEIKGKRSCVEMGPTKTSIGKFCGWRVLESLWLELDLGEYLSFIWQVALELECLERKVIVNAIRRLLVDSEGQENFANTIR